MTEPPIEAALFPDEAMRGQLEAFLSAGLQGARSRVACGSVAPTLDADAFARELAGFDFLEQRPYRETLSWVVAQMERGVTQMTHPRYFGLFNPAPSFAAECADRIAAQFNPQLASATTSPAAVAIEAHVIRAIGERAGFGESVAGHFTTGGSEANCTALICALLNANPRYAEDGVSVFAGRPVFYVSRDAHLAWIKIAMQAGLGRSAVRLVDTDGTGQMDAAMLQAQLGTDRDAGCRPVMIVATAGTTGAGIIDPIQDCARIAGECGAWLHVDAAWGGALIASEKRRPLLAGIEAADSLTIDAHKWFATTMGCGMFLTRHAALLSGAFQVSTVFMPSNDQQRDPYVASLLWSRRFVGLRLFLALAVAGWDGYARHVEHAIGLADMLRRTLEADGWCVVNDCAMAVLCLTPPPGSPDIRQIVRSVVTSGVAWISATQFEGRDVIRVCITNGQTSAADVHSLAAALRACVAERVAVSA